MFKKDRSEICSRLSWRAHVRFDSNPDIVGDQTQLPQEDRTNLNDELREQMGVHVVQTGSRGLDLVTFR